MIENLLNKYQELLIGAGLSENLAIVLENLSVFLVIALLAFLADRITKRILVVSIKNLVSKTRTKYDDILFKKKVFIRIAHIAPALVINATIVFFIDAEGLAIFIRLLTNLYIILVTSLVVDSLLSALHEIYLQLPVSRGRNIKGYVQLLKILIYVIALLVAISIITEKPVSGLLAGIGAFAAVLILVFKDTILGLVASIQIAANNMVHVGDWISMPSHNADGDVIDIGINTVKVQNWDKTISTIPTYALISESFNNWRGMSESGGRRIKRSINIDMQSIRFVDEKMLDKFKKIHVLGDYIEKKEKEIEEHNKKIGADESNLINGRRMTNLGTFRKYLEIYLQNHPKINRDMTFLIRHLQPTERGIPIEIYVFSNDVKWANYEAIQADIFDHILSVIPEFGLRVFQDPSGDDFKSFISNR
ncbi:MAG: mechanosensitive ion channel family protein [Bacteroidales bacterium]|nr:mechanosensitive ion channel family protein [Bacteroidales bacterium]